MANTITTGSITRVDVGSTTAAPPLYLVTGTPTVGSVLAVSSSDMASVIVEITNTFAGSLQCEKCVDNGTSWEKINLAKSGNGEITGVGVWEGNLGPNNGFRVRAIGSTWTGTADLSITIGGGAPITSTLGAGTAIIGKVGIDQTTDGTTNLVAAKQSGTSYIVSGLTATGSSPTLNPVSVSGVDGGGLKRHLLTDTSGAQVLGAGEAHMGEVGGKTLQPSANFTRPADTNAYASGDLVANNVTAASVTPMSFTATRIATGSGMIRRARLKKSTTTTTLASFRLHLYGADPSASTGITNGDNGAWLTKQASYLGSIDLDISGTSGRVFSDASEVVGTPAVGAEINFVLASGSTVYGLLEARAAYTPGTSEVITVELEILAN